MARYLSALSATAIAVTQVVAPAVAIAQEVSFNIPAGLLAPALDLWARQSGRQVVYQVDQLRQTRTSGVKGRMPADDALRTLLEGSGFRPHRDSGGAIAIVREAIAELPVTPPDVGVAAAGDGEAIVVTGTRLRNIESIASPLTRYNRQDIQRAARADLADFLQILPQNFSGGSFGLTPDGLSGTGAQTFLSPAGAVSPNLRGLGPGSTLTLVNGHRIAPSAGSAFVDIGVIPQSAIERIDIVPDGASAVYGSDAVGGVVNIILRDDLKGAETQLSYEMDDSGDYWNAEAAQSLGTDWGSGGAMVSGRYRKRSNLAAADRDFTEHVPGIQRPEVQLAPDLYPAANETTLFAVARQQFSPALEARFDGWFGRRNQDQVAGGGFVTRFVSRVDQYSLNGSIDIDLPRGLNGNVAGGYAASRDDTSQTSYTQANGQEFFITGSQNFDLWYASANVGGNVARLPGGAVAFSMGGEHRSEAFLFDFTGDLSAYRDVDREVNSGYAELLIPFVGPEMRLGHLRRVSLSLAGRYDHFSDFGGATTGRAGLLVDLTDVRLRSTYSTAFRAPNLNDVAQAGRQTVLGDPFTYFSPDRPDDFARVINVLGHSELKPEKARIFTIGTDIVPRAIPGLTVSATYFRYDYRDRLSTPPFAADILLRPDVFGGIFRPVTSVGEVEDILNQAETVILFDPSIPLSDYEYIIDMSFRNISAQRVDGVDVDVKYSRSSGPIDWTASAAATYVFRDDREIAEGSAPNDLVGLLGEQPDFKLRGELTATRGGLTVSGAVNHVSAFKNTSQLDNPRIDAFTTIDLNLQYRVDRLMAGGTTTLGVGVRNLLDADPPFIDRGDFSPSYDPANANPLGRVLLARVTQEW